MTQQKELLRFDNLGIHPTILEILEKHKYLTPTPIQQAAIPVALEGKDIVGIAQTGTGKTLAFGVPMIQHLAVNKGQGIILVPTRELALQVDETMQKIGNPLGMRTVVVIGGASMHAQIDKLKKKPHIIIATPGRLVDLLEQKVTHLDRIKVCVLDEADRMYDIGFAPQIRKIMAALPKDRQTMLFSATMPAEIAAIAQSAMKSPVRVEVEQQGTSNINIEQSAYLVKKDMKLQLLDKILADSPGTVLVFSRTKHGAKRIAATVRHMGHTAAEIHSNKSLSQRRHALEGFKTGAHRVLVATDIAARGIDVKGISLVINFDLPDNPEDYVHRIGRTGRAGLAGKAIAFIEPDQKPDVKKIERLIRKTLDIVALPTLPPSRVPPRENYRSTPHSRDGRSARPAHTGGRSMSRSGGGESRQYGQRNFSQSTSRSESSERPARGAEAPSYGQRSSRPSSSRTQSSERPRSSDASPYAQRRNSGARPARPSEERPSAGGNSRGGQSRGYAPRRTSTSGGYTDRRSSRSQNA